jgi:hypothetical protein
MVRYQGNFAAQDATLASVALILCSLLGHTALFEFLRIRDALLLVQRQRGSESNYSPCAASIDEDEHSGYLIRRSSMGKKLATFAILMIDTNYERT